MRAAGSGRDARPSRSSSDATGDSAGTAASSVQRAEAEPQQLLDVGAALAHEVGAGDAAVDDAVLHVLGHVGGRTSSTSTGALRHGNASARSPGCSGPSPASSSSATDGSRSRPFDRDRDPQAVCSLLPLPPVERQP